MDNLLQILDLITERVRWKAEFRGWWAIFYKSWIRSPNARTDEATSSKLIDNLYKSWIGSPLREAKGRFQVSLKLAACLSISFPGYLSLIYLQVFKIKEIETRTFFNQALCDPNTTDARNWVRGSTKTDSFGKGWSWHPNFGDACG